MAKRVHPCPYRADELDLSDGVCAHCGHPVVDLAAGSREEARRWMAQRSSGCVRIARDRRGGLLFHQKALTGALTVAAALAAGSAPRLTAELPSAVARGAAIELPELDGVSPTPPPIADENDAHPRTDDEVIRALLTVGGYIDTD